MVDANTRTPGLREIVGGDAVEDCLVFSDLLTPEIAQPALPRPSPQSNLLLVPSGNITCHPSQVFDPAKFGNFMESVTRTFDFVVFDSSPIGKYYDSIVLASHLDGVVLVTQAEKTPLRELRIAKQQFQDRDIRILGVVLNRRRFHIPQFIFQRFFG